MTFRQEYRGLERKFKAQIKEDNRHFEWNGEKRSYYLPNAEPEGPVDFVLVAMEPSGTAWIEGGKRTVPRNFIASFEDFMLQFCLRNYLCRDGQTYHVTDLAKGGMPTDQAKRTRNKRWPRWSGLLNEELKLVSKSDARVIALGSQVERFLEKQKLPRSLAGSIPHFSTQASLARTIAPQLLPEQYGKFSKDVGIADILGTAEELMQAKEFDDFRDSILENLPKDLTESGKKLLFTYKCLFAVMHDGVLTSTK